MLVRIFNREKEIFTMVTNNLPPLASYVHVKKPNWKNSKLMKVVSITHSLRPDLHEVFVHLK